jgi:hypothetical protein
MAVDINVVNLSYAEFILRLPDLDDVFAVGITCREGLANPLCQSRI